MAEEKARKPMNPALKQWLVPIAVLVCICLVCVSLLALANDLLYIDDNTKLVRSMQKIFPDLDLSSPKEATVGSVEISTGKVNKVYVFDSGLYIIEALGTGGYQGGTVTLYVAIDNQGIIKGWSVKDNDKQSYIDRVPSNAGTTWYVGKSVADDIQLDMTGATVRLTSTAIYNAILTACTYANADGGLGLGGAKPVDVAKNAVIELLGEDFASYTLNRVDISEATVDGQKSIVEALSDSNNTLAFLFAGTGDKGAVFAYVYGEVDAMKIVVVNGNDVIKSENVTGDEEFYNSILANPMYTFAYGSYSAYAIITGVNEAVYTVAGLKVGTMPNTYVLKITIATDGDHGKVTAIELLEDGFAPGISKDDANKLLDSNVLIGATSDTIASIYDSNKVGGATQSANLIRAAVEAALAHFDANIASND